MNAPTRKPLVGEPFLAEEIRADPVEVFSLRCSSRAKLWHDGEIDLHSAVDELQHAAEASGLIDKIGQDAVQALMVEAFAPLRDDLPRAEKKKAPAADDYDGSTFADACRKADEKQRRKPADPRLERLRRLMDDDVSIERAWHEIKTERLRKQVPIATLRTAEFLAQQNDPARFKAWLARHSREDREAIRQHLRNKRGSSCR
jgi:hypothetical protein